MIRQCPWCGRSADVRDKEFWIRVAHGAPTNVEGIVADAYRHRSHRCRRHPDGVIAVVRRLTERVRVGAAN